MIKKIIILFFTTSISLYAQISPGELTEVHADLEGMSNCTKCHELGEAVTNQKCLDCHTEIRELISVNRGYHSARDVQIKKCVECHSEHHGRGFEMIRFDKESFDHSLTGFILEGKHTNLKCEKCHNSDLINNSELKNRAGTFLGMGTACADCHNDYHQQTLSQLCDNCHSTKSFKPAVLFSHDNTNYILTGAHKTIDCVLCHAIENRAGKKFQRFSGIIFNECTDCHTDVHQGKLGNNCESCHSTQSFHKLSNQNLFDHNKTNFPLLGKHVSVDCEKCHTSTFKRVLKHEKCLDCHDDYHNGELSITRKSYDCKLCHSENGFTQAKYTIEDHKKSDYNLTGSHLAVPCSGCHRKNERWGFNIEVSSCMNCHQNVHGSSISKKFLNDSNCVDCHSTVSWLQVVFDHNKTEFSLSGKHSSTACYVCHDINKTGNVSEYIFIDLTTTCESCHTDPHFNQFRLNGVTDCARCHEFENWKPVKFNHENTRFLLQGAHSKVLCEQCHQRTEMQTGTFVKYRFSSTECITCHTSGSRELSPKGDS